MASTNDTKKLALEEHLGHTGSLPDLMKEWLEVETSTVGQGLSINTLTRMWLRGKGVSGNSISTLAKAYYESLGLSGSLNGMDWQAWDQRLIFPNLDGLLTESGDPLLTEAGDPLLVE